MTAATVVTVAVFAVCVIGIIALLEWSRRRDRDDADNRARLVVESADRIVRLEAARLNHPSNRGTL